MRDGSAMCAEPLHPEVCLDLQFELDRLSRLQERCRDGLRQLRRGTLTRKAYAALVMLGHTNIITEVGHHAPGFYSAMFLDSSLEEMGINPWGL